MMPQRFFRFCIPGYNWCGPGCSGPGAPVNKVDAACKQHDMCYRRHGNRCECDQMFLNRLRPLVNSRRKEGRHAQTMYNYMKLQTAITCNRYRK
ncbi:phospholipase [Terribacillus saccharophilus]|nr:phospholipase [Terribacillus saccharophilus]